MPSISSYNKDKKTQENQVCIFGMFRILHVYYYVDFIFGPFHVIRNLANVYQIGQVWVEYHQCNAKNLTFVINGIHTILVSITKVNCFWRITAHAIKQRYRVAHCSMRQAALSWNNFFDRYRFEQCPEKNGTYDLQESYTSIIKEDLNYVLWIYHATLTFVITGWAEAIIMRILLKMASYSINEKYMRQGKLQKLSGYIYLHDYGGFHYTGKSCFSKCHEIKR